MPTPTPAPLLNNPKGLKKKLFVAFRSSTFFFKVIFFLNLWRCKHWWGWQALMFRHRHFFEKKKFLVLQLSLPLFIWYFFKKKVSDAPTHYGKTKTKTHKIVFIFVLLFVSVC